MQHNSPGVVRQTDENYIRINNHFSDSIRMYSRLWDKNQQAFISADSIIPSRDTL